MKENDPIFALIVDSSQKQSATYTMTLTPTPSSKTVKRKSDNVNLNFLKVIYQNYVSTGQNFSTG